MTCFHSLVWSEWALVCRGSILKLDNKCFLEMINLLSLILVVFRFCKNVFDHLYTNKLNYYCTSYIRICTLHSQRLYLSQWTNAQIFLYFVLRCLMTFQYQQQLIWAGWQLRSSVFWCFYTISWLRYQLLHCTLANSTSVVETCHDITDTPTYTDMYRTLNVRKGQISWTSVETRWCSTLGLYCVIYDLQTVYNTAVVIYRQRHRHRTDSSCSLTKSTDKSVQQRKNSPRKLPWSSNKHTTISHAYPSITCYYCSVWSGRVLQLKTMVSCDFDIIDHWQKFLFAAFEVGTAKRFPPSTAEDKSWLAALPQSSVFKGNTWMLW